MRLRRNFQLRILQVLGVIVGAFDCQLYCTVWQRVRGSTLPVHWVGSKPQSPTLGRAHVTPAATAPRSSGRRPWAVDLREHRRRRRGGGGGGQGAGGGRALLPLFSALHLFSIQLQDSTRRLLFQCFGTELGNACLQYSPVRRCLTWRIYCTLCSLKSRVHLCRSRPPGGSRSDRSNFPIRPQLGAGSAEQVVGMGRAGDRRWPCSWRLAR